MGQQSGHGRQSSEHPVSPVAETLDPQDPAGRFFRYHFQVHEVFIRKKRARSNWTTKALITS